MVKNEKKLSVNFKRTSKGIRLRHDLIGWLLLFPALFCFTFFVWRPTITGIVYSFYDMQGFELQEFVGLRNYKVVLGNTQFLKTLWNTVQYVFFYIIFGFIPPIIVAMLLNEVRCAKKSLKFLIYFPSIIPGIVTNMLWGYMYDPGAGGLLNRLLDVVGLPSQLWLNSKAMVIPCIVFSMAWNGMGSNMLYYFAALQGVNRELYEAAVIDGAGILHRVRYVTFPQISGVILLMFVRTVINIFQVMEAPLVMTDGGPNGASVSLGLQTYRYAFEYYQAPYALALGVVEFFMLIGLTVLYFKMSHKVETE